MTITPDLAGFAEAQERLRQQMGDDVTFHIPVAEVWPADAPLDEETGRPYDPLIEPLSGGGHTDVVKRVGVVYRPIPVNLEDPLGDAVNGGLRWAESIVITVGGAAYTDVAAATELTLRGLTYKITAIVQDSSPDDRWVYYAETK